MKYVQRTSLALTLSIVTNMSYAFRLISRVSPYTRHAPTTIPKVVALRTTSTISTRCYAKKSRSRRQPLQLKPITFVIPNYTSVSNLSNMLNVKIERLVRDLTNLGFSNVTHNYILSREYIELILQEYNYELPETSAAGVTSENIYEELKSPIDPKNLSRRPPIVTIMGHVDHGKTTILDYLRKSSLVSQEHGGITQHIGAFQIETPISKKKITFLDTPGHAAFLKMRERGANITDIVVLVVSIEDSVMPQTIEAIKHVRNSGNELIVAITKIDRINKRERERAIEKVTNDLIVNEVSVEKIGGDVQVIPISARDGENMDLLEESIVLLSDVMDLKSESSVNTSVEGWILESEVKKSMGNVCTVLIKKGVLQKGKVLICGNTYCKVRSILDERGKPIDRATPAQAVEITGWKELPQAGDEAIQVKNESTAKKYVSKRQSLIEVEREASHVEHLNEQRAYEASTKQKLLEATEEDEEESPVDVEHDAPKKINFIIKADVSGSVEAIQESISSLGNDEVICNIVSASVGIPNESDLKMARITTSKILCFNLGNLPNEVVNNRDNIDVRQYNVIYKLIEDVTEVLTDNLKPIYETKQIATADIREIFNFTAKKKIIKIAGCRVTNGQINRNSMVKIIRGEKEEVIFDGKLATLKQGKEDSMEVKKGNECGLTFENDFENYETGDKVIVYEKVKVPRYL